MAKKAEVVKNSGNTVFILLSIFATLAFIPNAMDAFSFPKASVIIAGGIWYFVSDFKNQKSFRNSSINLIVGGFVLWFLILIFTSDNKWISLFGVNGRSTGILFYLALIVIFWNVRKFEFNFHVRIFNLFINIGMVVLIYGLLQMAGADPFKWTLEYVGTIGLFGNPNFMGAYSALIGIAGFSIFLNTDKPLKNRIYGLLILCISVVNIYGSHARQGYVSLIIGIIPRNLLCL